jgi:hypothetical protein
MGSKFVCTVGDVFSGFKAGAKGAGHSMKLHKLHFVKGVIIHNTCFGFKAACGSRFRKLPWVSK